MASKEEVNKHMMRVVGVVQNALLKRALHDASPNPRLNFWRLIMGDLLDVAVLEWSKVFGSDAEPSHWKRVIPEADHAEFRSRLLRDLNTDEQTWRAYWEMMKRYRDNYVAHVDDRRAEDRYPDLTLALESSYFYYARLIVMWRALGEVRYPEDLRDYAARYAAQARETARIAMASTAAIEERVF